MPRFSAIRPIPSSICAMPSLPRRAASCAGRSPGAYIEGGGKVELYHGLFEWLVLGANLTLIERAYRSDIVGSLTERRRDCLVIPGAAVVFPNLFATHRHLRLEGHFLAYSFDDATAC